MDTLIKMEHNIMEHSILSSLYTPQLPMPTFTPDFHSMPSAHVSFPPAKNGNGLRVIPRAVRILEADVQRMSSSPSLIRIRASISDSDTVVDFDLHYSDGDLTITKALVDGKPLPQYILPGITWCDGVMWDLHTKIIKEVDAYRKWVEEEHLEEQARIASREQSDAEFLYMNDLAERHRGL